MSQFVLYKTEDGRDRIELRLDRETAWLSLNQLSALFERDKSVMSRHVANVLNDGELDAGSVVANFATSAADGKTYQVDHYNLDMILAVGYRVRSPRAPSDRIRELRQRIYICCRFENDTVRLKKHFELYARMIGAPGTA